DLTLAGYLSDGSPDLSFGSRGLVFPLVLPRDSVNFSVSAALQLDGKLVVTGAFYLRRSESEPVLMRYNPNGTRDTTSADNGFGALRMSGASFIQVAIQADGRIVTADSSRLARHNPNGTLDATFGTGGTALTEIVGAALIQQRDGKLVVAGSVK